LYCASEEDSGFAREWQIDRAGIADFKLDHDARNGRLIVATMALAGGLCVGIQSYQTASSQNAQAAGVLGGLLGAGLGALAGVPLSCLSGHCVEMPNPVLGPMPYTFSVSVPLGRMARHARRWYGRP
jgi:hypothetical protein